MASTIKILTVSDIHRVKALYQDLESTVAAQKPDVLVMVGDFLDGLGTAAAQITTEDCATVLARTACREVVFVRGNHEDFEWWKFAAAWGRSGRPLNTLHGEAYTDGPLTMVGFPCGLGDETAFIGAREELPTPEVWLRKLNRRIGPAMRTLWLMHEPPVGTPLSEKQGPVAGNPLWNEAIERFSPWLTISGHDHRSPTINGCWHHKIGQTVCVNVGQSDSRPLHYCLIEAAFPKSTPCLPSRLKITAHPWTESLTLTPATVGV